jgi:hypothetical protein
MKILKNKSGNMIILLLFILMFLFSFSAIVSEIFRINSIQGHVDAELQRAVNIALEDAMHDTWRQDAYAKVDTVLAEEKFISYLYNELDLSSGLEKWQGGSKVYSLVIENMSASYDPPRLTVRGKAVVKSAFKFLTKDIEIPFDISSRNMRLD